MQGRASTRSSARVLRAVALLGALFAATEGIRRLVERPLGTVAGLLADGRSWGSLPLTLQLAAGCAAALAACWVWLVLCAAVVTADAVRDDHGRCARLCPRLVRTVVLASLGLAVGAGPAYPDSGTGSGTGTGAGAGVVGLSLPDRVAVRPHRVLRVRAGDTLWAIAAQRLPHQASNAAVALAWQRLAAANADRVGDPDLIFPGTVLRVPDLGSALGKESS